VTRGVNSVTAVTHEDGTMFPRRRTLRRSRGGSPPSTGVVTETPRVRTLILDVPGWPGHRPGQHVDVRLTAEDGYQAQRSYFHCFGVAGRPARTDSGTTGRWRGLAIPH
jgi:hypothetical protein